MLKKMFAFPVVRMAVVAVVLLAVVLALPPTRALAGEFLDLFRVRQVVLLPIAPNGFGSTDMLANQLEQMLSRTTVMTDEPNPPVNVASAEEASNLAGFAVRIPEVAMPMVISVADSSAFTMRIDNAEAQVLLDAGGRSDLSLPDQADGADISINIPASVQVMFGAAPNSGDSQTGITMDESCPECVSFIQMPSPSVNAPDDLDVNELAEVALQFAGLTAEEANAFTERVDLETTLVLPIPMDSEVTYSDVLVDEVLGKLIQNGKAPYNHSVVWVKGGIVYIVNGWGSDTFRAFEIINALP